MDTRTVTHPWRWWWVCDRAARRVGGAALGRRSGAV